MRDPTVNTYCSTWDAQKPLAWRSKYGWTAFCRSVTNKRNGVSKIARIVDQCKKPKGGLDLDDQTMFNLIDTKTKQGYHDGHMLVSYKFVKC
ncbi:unnamed protein product [Linum perenne]